ncbi:MAG: helix-turn-helix transcriptional regulator [Candidatus Bathyarchaeia archaeon]
MYTTLHDLERRGLLAENNIVVGGKVRRYYRVTEKGLEILEESKKDKGADGGGI